MFLINFLSMILSANACLLCKRWNDSGVFPATGVLSNIENYFGIDDGKSGLLQTGKNSFFSQHWMFLISVMHISVCEDQPSDRKTLTELHFCRIELEDLLLWQQLQTHVVLLITERVFCLSPVFICSYMFLAPVFGYLGDRYNRKIIMSFGITFWSLVTLASSYTPQEVSHMLFYMLWHHFLLDDDIKLKHWDVKTVFTCLVLIWWSVTPPPSSPAAFLGAAVDSRPGRSRRGELLHHCSHHHRWPLCEGQEDEYALHFLFCHSGWQVG